jgi:putative tryptophan/tyrosine transport system substrate-binding protein
MITRRQVLFTLGAGACAPLAAIAQQQAKVRRVGFLLESDPSNFGKRFDAFDAGMKALGYFKGRDYVVEIRAAKANVDLATLAAELVAQKVDLIIPSGTPSAVAAAKVTREIPVVITAVGDPVANGLAASLARPGGNVTGLTSLTAELVSKRLDLLRQFVPGMSIVGMIYEANNPSSTLSLARLESDCRKLGLKHVRAAANNAQEMPVAFASLVRSRAQGMILAASGTLNPLRDVIVAQAAKHRLPAAYGQSDFVEAGGLISYSPDYSDLYRRAAAYADKIFKGTKPGDLPIEQPVKFELAVNTKTAKAIGIKVPQSILVQATKVIE